MIIDPIKSSRLISIVNKILLKVGGYVKKLLRQY